MQIIKLNATQSTNSYLKSVEAKSALEDFTVVIAKNQTLGRGQQQTVWESEGGKNLTFSVLKNEIQVPSTEAFLLSI
ncbi:MAG: biotin--[acetyl-CoA-carboxylase] ligase, partial [Maribacter sp.]